MNSTLETQDPVPSSNAIKNTAAPASKSVASSRKISESLWSAFSRSDSQQGFFREVIDLLGMHLNAPFGRVVIETSQGNSTLSYKATDAAEVAWEKRCSGPLLDSRYRNLANARTYLDSKSNSRFAILACPISFTSDACQGSIAVVVAYTSREQMASQLQELQTVISMAATMALDVGKSTTKKSVDASGDPASASRAAGYRSLTEFAFAIVNNLKAKLGCESVSFGVVRKQHVKLLCMSGASFVDEKSTGTHQLEQVMDECLDANEICCLQNQQDRSPNFSSGYLLHRSWQGASGGAAVASIPLQIDGEIVAILSLRHVPGQTFSREQLEKVRELAAPLMPGALLLDRADRRLRDHAWTYTKQLIADRLETDTWTRRVIFGAILGLVFLIAFGKQTYYITVPSTIFPSDEREISTPFEGTIAEVFVRPGDSVTVGQKLVRIDTRLLLLELQQAKADRDSAEMESVQGISKSDPGSAAIARARADAAAILVQKIERKIQLSEIVAPSSGVILSGDLDKRIGESVPIGTPLLGFAPLDHWNVLLESPEFATSLLSLGQIGSFAAHAKPGVSLDLSIQHIQAAAETRDGKIVILTEASLASSSPDWIRSGMEGTSQVNVGRHPIWWVWVHRLVDRVRIQWWRF